MLQVTYPEIVRVLEGLSSTIPAAESHGCLCGALCTSISYSLDDWLEEIVPDTDAVDPSDREALNLLFSDTLNALRGEHMEFEPLLPDDQETLDRRARSLGEWCQGFLFGFGSVAPPKADQLSANVKEVLRDLTHISQAQVDTGESGEEEERAYAEVVEYVRAGVQLIHDELIDARVGESPHLAPPDDSRPN